MYNSSTLVANETEHMIQQYGDMLFRISLVMLGNEVDAEDAVQETALRYIQKAPAFNDSEHKKAWLIKVITNQCRDMLRFRANHPQISIEDLQNCVSNPESSGIVEALMSIPERFKTCMVLYYVEEYRIEEIATIIDRSSSAVKMRLQKGRKLLEAKYRKEYL